jgi:outer membrane protein assembly factor BamB
MMARLLFTLSVLTVMLVGCSTSPSPVKPPKTLTKIDNAFNIKKRWHYKIDEGASDNYLRLQPVVNEGIVYSVDHTGTVTAFRIADRTILWKTDIGYQIGSPLTLEGSILYLGTSDGHVIAINKGDGKLNWQVRVSSEVLAAPAVQNGYVVVRCVNGEVIALNSNNGEKLWSDRQITPSLTLRGTSAPVIHNGLVLSAFDNGKLIAYELRTGKIIWQTPVSVARGRSALERMVDIDAEIVISNNVVYAVAFQGKLEAVALDSGKVIWSRDLDSYIGMDVDATRIYIVDSNSQILALDKANGATHWKQDALLRRSLTRPLVDSNYIIVGDFNGFLHWFRRDTGELAARVKLDTFNYRSPSLDEEEDLNYPKTLDILAAPLKKEGVVIAMDRHGHAEAFEISYP